MEENPMSTKSLRSRRRFLGASAISIAAAHFGLFDSWFTLGGQSFAEDHNTPRDKLKLPVEGRLPSLAGATGWLNVPPLKSTDLHGKVVLVNFWTYSCINSLRALPYSREWAKKYKDNGLVVVGIHAPEFDFEKSADNVRRAVQGLNIDYPIALDSNHTLWRAFKNDYWPALYFIDANGRIRHHQFGEGEYVTSERVIQKLLAESGAKGIDRSLVPVEARGVEAAADLDDVKSPETYVGYHRSPGFISPDGPVLGRRHTYSAPARSNVNEWALAGIWTVGKQSALLNAAPGRIVYRFHARDLNLVMAPAVKGTSVKCRILIDGRAPVSDHGIDVDEHGNGKVDEPRMYQLVRQSTPIADQQFEIEFVDPGVEVFVFTFG
jgi:thiol-disulfide isomerase/thioredoxin